MGDIISCIGQIGLAIMYLHIAVRDYIIIPILGAKYSIPIYVIVVICISFV